MKSEFLRNEQFVAKNLRRDTEGSMDTPNLFDSVNIIFFPNVM